MKYRNRVKALKNGNLDIAHVKVLNPVSGKEDRVATGKNWKFFDREHSLLKGGQMLKIEFHDSDMVVRELEALRKADVVLDRLGFYREQNSQRFDGVPIYDHEGLWGGEISSYANMKVYGIVNHLFYSSPAALIHQFCHQRDSFVGPNGRHTFVFNVREGLQKVQQQLVRLEMRGRPENVGYDTAYACRVYVLGTAYHCMAIQESRGTVVTLTQL